MQRPRKRLLLWVWWDLCLHPLWWGCLDLGARTAESPTRVICILVTLKEESSDYVKSRGSERFSFGMSKWAGKLDHSLYW